MMHPHLVSIHAPTWGATYGTNIKNPYMGFQSTHPHGVRQRVVRYVESILAFQSTHPHGVRLYILVYLIFNLMFQSTHPHGVRLYVHVLHIDNSVSIHAPTWGATVKFQGHDFNAKFQSTHPHGVRLSSSKPDMTKQNKFQSTHPHGVRLAAKM